MGEAVGRSKPSWLGGLCGVGQVELENRRPRALAGSNPTLSVLAELSELSLKDRAFFRAYRWRRIDPVPWTPLEKPLSQSRLALVSTAGLVLPEQEPFDGDERGGDVSFREIPNDTDIRDLVDTQRSRSYDHAGVQGDANVAFPIDRVNELAALGRVGSVAPRHLSFMGSITAPGRLLNRTAPLAAQRLVDDGVDCALLVPI